MNSIKPTSDMPSAAPLMGIGVSLAIYFLLPFALVRNWVLSGTAALSIILLLSDMVTRSGQTKTELEFNTDAETKTESISELSTRETSHAATGKYRPTSLLIAKLVLLNVIYLFAATSWLQIFFFSLTCYITIFSIFTYRSSVVRDSLCKITNKMQDKVHVVEDRIACFKWPALDFDGRGMLTLAGGTLQFSKATLVLHGIDVTLDLEEGTKMAAKVDRVTIRIGRDITIGEVYVNVKGSMPLSPSLAANESDVVALSGTPLSPSRASTMDVSTPLLANQSASSLVGLSTSKPPPLPPRKPTPSTPVQPSDSKGEDSDEDDHALKAAIDASLKDQGPSRASSPTKMSTIHHSTSSAESLESEQLLPENGSKDGTYHSQLQAALDESAVSHSSSTANPSENDQDQKAATAASLQENPFPSKPPPEKRVKLRDLINKIPKWLRIRPGPLATRLLLSPVAYLHPATIDSVAITLSGQRVIELLEQGGLKRAQKNKELYRLVRKVFAWISSGDISVILNHVRIRPHIPVAVDHQVQIDIVAKEPTAYKNSAGREDLLAKIDGFSANLRIPTHALPNHEAFSTVTGNSATFLNYSLLFSLPGVFNKELLTIGAALIKATTMMDMKADARTVEVNTKQFSFRQFGVSLKQAAGDLAKQKGVEWGLRDEQLAAMVTKFARLLKILRVDVGHQGKVPIDLSRRKKWQK